MSTTQTDIKKLTNEEIAKVFAMYLGQDIKVCNGYSTVYSPHFCATNNYKLLLTPLSKITDEHAIEVAKMIGWKDEDAEKYPILDSNISIMGKTFVERLLDGKAQRKIIYVLNVYQYLISKGYAVPLWFGIDHPENGKSAIELNIAIEK